MPRIVYIVTHPMTARFLLAGQLKFFVDQKWEVSLICSPGEDLQAVAKSESVPTIEIPIDREIRIWNDLKSLFRLYSALNRLKPQIVHASTPKAGLLGMIASWACRIPIRIYMIRGLRMETATGIVREILKWTETIACACAHRVICVSDSLKQEVVRLNLCPVEKLVVLGKGSSNGIETRRFLPRSNQENEDLKKELGIPPDSPVIGFVGRFTRDKGIAELLDCYESLVQEFPHLYLLALGEFEEGDPISKQDHIRMTSHKQVIRPGFVPDTAPYYQIMNVLVFPSYREGFPNAPLEAAASGVPTVGFRATGTIDAVVDQQTGILVETRNALALKDAIRRYLLDETFRNQNGEQARQWSNHFQRERVWTSLLLEYQKLLETG